MTKGIWRNMGSKRRLRKSARGAGSSSTGRKTQTSSTADPSGSMGGPKQPRSTCSSSSSRLTALQTYGLRIVLKPPRLGESFRLGRK